MRWLRAGACWPASAARGLMLLCAALQGERLTKAADAYAFGLLCWELYTDRSAALLPGGAVRQPATLAADPRPVAQWLTPCPGSSI